MILTQKKCSKCGEVKPLEEFNKHSRSADGVQAHCRECMKEANRKWYAANFEKKRIYIQEWQKANPEKMRARQRKYWAANVEVCRERGRKWREANPEKQRELSRRWRDANPEKSRELARSTGKKNQTANYANLREMFGSACLDCEREYPMPIFHYHHLDPSTKTEGLNIGGWRWERVRIYVQRCVQLCPTCHCLRHFLERSKRQGAAGEAKCS